MMKSKTRYLGAVGISLTILLSLSACSEDKPAEPDTTPTLTSAGAGEADGIEGVSAKDYAAAEATVTAYFSVKNPAEASFKDRIDSQAVFLTDSSIHPDFSSAEIAGPTGIADTDLNLKLGEARELAGSIILPFDAVLSSESYTLINGELDEAQAVGSWTQWVGKATLKEQDGVWLISKFTTDSIVSGSDSAPEQKREKPKK